MSLIWGQNSTYIDIINIDIINEIIDCLFILPLAAPEPASSLRRFLVSVALILLSLTHSLLILSASAMDTTLGRPLP